jgi:hypothetical protein
MRAIAETFVCWQLIAAALSEVVHFIVSLI